MNMIVLKLSFLLFVLTFGEGCVLPPFPENGNWSVLGGLKDKPGEVVSKETIIKVKCNPGYKLYPDLSFRFCMSRGNWEEIPKCISVEGCVLPPFPKNGKWSIMDRFEEDPGEVVSIDTVIKIKCKPGYKLYPHLPLGTCMSGGNWTQIPKCVSNETCVLPPFPENGKWLVDGGIKKSPGEVVSENIIITVECETGYKVYPDTNFSVCKKGGNWDQTHVCERIVITETIPVEDNRPTGDDAVLRTPDLIRKYGYKVEIHEVITKDKYILSHHRIPFGKHGPGKEKRQAIILQHGLLGSSSDWILKTPNGGLGYLLADNGYDVWLMNNRGNEYSEKHASLDPHKDAKNFWDFSWHEIGIYDLADSIDYVLNITNQQEILHIGHSQGATALYVLLSERPEYNKKVKVHISYSPIAFIKHTTSLLFKYLQPWEQVGGLPLLKLAIGEYNFDMSSFLIKGLTLLSCTSGGPTPDICSSIYYLLMGDNRSQISLTMLPVIYGHFPAGASVMQMAHYIQEISSGKFRKFDYGQVENIKKYNQTTPPDYNCGNIQVPIYTFCGDKDPYVQLPDVLEFHKLLTNLKEAIYLKDWAHMDFYYGVDAEKEVYSKTITILSKYT